MFHPTTDRARQRGFTLIEVMIVVAVIAILALILIPNFTNARAQAQTATCESNLREIATAAELYYSDVQTYPISGNVSSTLFTAATSGTVYLETTPIDPAASDPTQPYAFVQQQASALNNTQAGYTITCPGIHAAFTLTKLTENGNSTSPHTLIYASGYGLESQ
jgi:general secretion pathway protein G